MNSRLTKKVNKTMSKMFDLIESTNWFDPTEIDELNEDLATCHSAGITMRYLNQRLHDWHLTEARSQNWGIVYTARHAADFTPADIVEDPLENPDELPF